jgi:HEPN domain-containing protein
MNTILAHKLVNIGSSLHWMEDAGLLSQMTAATGEQRNQRQDFILESVDALKALVEDVGCTHTGKAMGRFRSDIQSLRINETEFGIRIKEIRMSFVDEMKSHLFFYVPEVRSKYYAGTVDMFGDEVKARFPSAIREIEGAGQAFACGLNTACVFHLMRIMEIGLRATATSLHISIKPTENWGEMLKQISTANQGTEKSFYSGVRGSFAAVKDAWRNSTMHFDRSYSEKEAEEIIAAVKTFMRCLSIRLDESGKLYPPA